MPLGLRWSRRTEQTPRCYDVTFMPEANMRQPLSRRQRLLEDNNEDHHRHRYLSLVLTRAGRLAVLDFSCFDPLAVH